MEEGENPRDLERRQILRLINLVAEEIYVAKFDPEIGTDKIESRLQKGQDFPLDHLRAFRMSKEEIVYNWLGYVGQIARQYFIMLGKPDHDSVEDQGGNARLEDVRNRFGERVGRIVEAYSDSLADTARGERKANWEERKKAYLAHLEKADEDILRVSLADKVHNARAILRDLRKSDVGEKNLGALQPAQGPHAMVLPQPRRQVP